jgi:hypothetical protein
VDRTLSLECGSVVKIDGEKGAVDFDVAVVFDEPQLAELVQEEVDARSRGAHHLGECLLRELRQPQRLVFLAVARASRFSLELKG